MSAHSQQDAVHEQILREMLEQFGPVFEASPDDVYLYLDDRHKICNDKLARMFGLTGKERSAAPNFLGDFVAEQDQEKVATNYQRHIATRTRPVSFWCRALRKDGSTFNAETEMIPITWRGNPVAYHFVREVK
jgi:PAS domain S-box-containing protein